MGPEFDGLSLMTNVFTRGSAPGRARSEDQRPGSFKKGHEKRGGRRRGTPNKFSAQHKKNLREAVYRVGMDANGKWGLLGYLRWIARRHPLIFCRLLASLMEWQELEGTPETPFPTVEELDERVRTCIGLGGGKPAQAPPPDPESPWAWTGRDDSVGQLMDLALTHPKDFCTLLQAAFLPPPTARQRWRAARRASEERLRAKERLASRGVHNDASCGKPRLPG
jgi:hypothetical protein